MNTCLELPETKALTMYKRRKSISSSNSYGIPRASILASKRQVLNGMDVSSVDPSKKPQLAFFPPPNTSSREIYTYIYIFVGWLVGLVCLKKTQHRFNNESQTHYVRHSSVPMENSHKSFVFYMVNWLFCHGRGAVRFTKKKKKKWLTNQFWISFAVGCPLIQEDSRSVSSADFWGVGGKTATFPLF